MLVSRARSRYINPYNLGCGTVQCPIWCLCMNIDFSRLKTADLRRTKVAIGSENTFDMVSSSALNRSNLLIEWSSLTKTVTGRIFEKLVQSGNIRDTRVDEVLPFARLGQATLHDLVQHRAGLPLMHPGGSTGLIGDPCKGSANYSFLESLPTALWRAARDHFGEYRYSNLGYALLGKAIEVTTGETWFDIARDLVLPMDRYPSVTVNPSVSLQAVPRLMGTRRRPWSMATGAYRAAGGLWSTFDDLVRYADNSLWENAKAGWFALEGGIVFHTGQARDTGTCVILNSNKNLIGVAYSVFRRPNAAKDALMKVMFKPKLQNRTP